MEEEIIYNYKKKLVERNLPIFFDYIHVQKTFNINSNISNFLVENVSTYRVKKKRKFNRYSGKYIQEYRTIYTVSKDVAFIQKWILKNILEKIPASEACHAFVKGKSLVTNASKHCNNADKGWLLRLDIKDFFESITFNHVKKIFRDLGYSKGASEALSQITTVQGKLCQGFSTSPMIANLVLKDFDEKITSNFKKEGIIYTRYADDLFFSGNDRSDIHNSKIIRSIKQQVSYYLSRKGLLINKSKTSLQVNSHKRITGLYLENGLVQVSKTYIKELERELFFCKKYGIATHLRHSGKIDKMDFYKYIMGKCSFVKMVQPKLGNQLISQVQELYREL